MLGFRLSAQHRPKASRVSDVVVSRYAGVYEIDPELMQEHVHQQTMPEWDFNRIIEQRREHLAWMQKHWADEMISGDALLAELEQEG